MRLLSLKTSCYRNLEGENLTLSDGINLLYGSNASGKTNTLECAYIFASGKSFNKRSSDKFKNGCASTGTAPMDFIKSKVSQNSNRFGGT